MTWFLRRADADDLEAIMRIETSTFATDAWSETAMRAELTSAHTYYLVALRNETQEVEGYAGLLAPGGARQADIQTIAVAERARRGGLGRALMHQLMSEARQRGAREVFLEVRADNPHAQALYESLGFEVIGVRPHYYQPDGVDAVVMRAPLDAPQPGLAKGES
ncbi:ribosomal protein S18-alanine N-acetyltransferase [Salinibacterium sp. SYSU T00001]|uniref:ribosomal protein S18-alanine N-acetyltransferase n=1 Tax=Homoserinimonas sedimenticola TaxID=2986805 RepID=UPI0022368B3E|nr:ribosomal protein S18-alanine N-acetyltransferase [Salinibacterium sedimenticola]MCW4385280.1 ribosomal protein S18-alanine N-acetyltransferase [Salinibacterium sedimenticola]